MAQPVPLSRAVRAERGISSYPRPAGFPARITDATYVVALRASLRGHKPDTIGDILSVPRHVAAEWMRTGEWARACRPFADDIRDVDIIVATSLSSLALQKVAERLEHGDAHVTKSGVVVYKPVDAMSATNIAMKLAERKDQLERQRDGIPEPNTIDTLENLFKVASILSAAGAAAAKAATPEPVAIDGEVIVVESTGVEADERAA